MPLPPHVATKKEAITLIVISDSLTVTVPVPVCNHWHIVLLPTAQQQHVPAVCGSTGWLQRQKATIGGTCIQFPVRCGSKTANSHAIKANLHQISLRAVVTFVQNVGFRNGDTDLFRLVGHRRSHRRWLFADGFLRFLQ